MAESKRGAFHLDGKFRKVDIICFIESSPWDLVVSYEDETNEYFVNIGNIYYRVEFESGCHKERIREMKDTYKQFLQKLANKMSN